MAQWSFLGLITAFSFCAMTPMAKAASLADCGNIDVNMNAQCDVMAKGGCTVSDCTPVACSATLYAECKGSCEVPDVSCQGSCQGTCEANCTAKGSIDCSADCKGRCNVDCSGKCTSQCASDANKAPVLHPVRANAMPTARLLHLKRLAR